MNPLRAAATRTFEELAFLFAAEDPDERQVASPLNVQATVRFHGDREGRLVIRVYGDILPLLAASMLGADDLPGDALQRDALGEVANVICGNVLPEVAGAAPVFHLDRPEVTTSEEAGAEAAGTPFLRDEMGLEDGRVELLLYLAA